MPLIFTAILLILALVNGCQDPSEPGSLVSKTVTEDASLPSLALNETTFHLKTFGDAKKPVIIVLHGGPGNDYRYLLPLKERYNGYSLVDDYFLVFWDQRGTGLSKRHDSGDITLEKYAEDLEKLVEHFAPNNHPVILLGHSWGGTYAAQYMDRHPARLSGCILMEPGALSSELGKGLSQIKLNPLAKWLNSWMWGRQLVSAGDHERADYYLALGVANQKEIKPERHSEAVPGFRMGTAVTVKLALEELGRSFDFTTHLAEVDKPVLFIVGAYTEDLGAEFQQKQMKKFRNAKLASIPNAGHNEIVWSQPEKSLMEIKQYLTSLNLRRQP